MKRSIRIFAPTAICALRAGCASPHEDAAAAGGELRYLLEREAAGWNVVEVWRLGQPGGPQRIR